jgi:formylglycine-generating enzyme required for sulfatase activity
LALSKISLHKERKRMSDLSEQSRRCPGCMKDKGPARACPQCGFDEALPSASKIVLPCRTLLNKQYWIGRVLGKPGGFGITYLAWDTGLDTPVAIKEYFPKPFAGREALNQTVQPHSGEDGELFAHGLQAFLKEAKTLARFDHPHIVKPRNVFEENGTAYLVMDYLEGETLEDHLARQPARRVEAARALEILLPVMEGLELVHEQGFIHRDIKPLNIYLTRFAHNRKERSILLDFGAARLALGAHSQSLSIVLTPDFAAPEQYHTRGQGAWTDVYGLAATLYRMVAGTPPQQANSRLLEDRLQDPRESAPGLADDFASALLSGLALSPRQRPRTVAEFASMLTATAAESSDPESTIPPKARAKSPLSAPPPLDPPPVPARPKRPPEPEIPVKRQPPVRSKRSRSVLGAGALALILTAGAVGYRYWPYPEPLRPDPNAAIAKPEKPPAKPAADKPEPVENENAAIPEAPCPYCPAMIEIPAGAFMMGSNDGDSDEKPVHRVSMKAFSIGKYEVTQSQWREIMGDNPSYFKDCGNDCPVENVSHRDVQRYIAKLNARSGKNYRLPTEAEWEYACRAGGTQEYCGSDDADAVAWHDGNSGGKTHPAGRKRANAWGLHDMSGNAWEWTCSAYTEKGYDGSELTDINDARVLRALRGGSWGHGPRDVRAADRDGGAPAERDIALGFRLAQD